MPDPAEIKTVQSIARILSRLSSYFHASNGVVAPESFPAMMDLEELLQRFKELYTVYDTMGQYGWLHDGAVDMLVVGETGVTENKKIGAEIFEEGAKFERDWLEGKDRAIGAEGLRAWARRVDEILELIDRRLLAGELGSRLRIACRCKLIPSQIHRSPRQHWATHRQIMTSSPGSCNGSIWCWPLRSSRSAPVTQETSTCPSSSGQCSISR
jgi:hypothetical protein